MISLALSLLSLLLSLFKEGQWLIHYINITFLIGLFFLIISGSSFVIHSGFFHTFFTVTKRLFNRVEDLTDEPVWKNVPTDFDEQATPEKRKKTELFIYLPFFISFVLIAQSVLLLFLL